MAEGRREGNLQVGDGGISNTVEVRGFSKKTSQELMEMYFENSRRSGGGDLEEVKIRDEVAYITFKEAEVAEKVASRSNHLVDGHTLAVTLFHPLPPKPCYQNRVLIQGVNNAITEELLRNFLETKSKAEVTEFLYGEEDGNVVVTLSDNIDIVQLGKIFQESSIQGVFLKAARVAISNCILVQDLHPSTSHDVILYYFENKRRSGGGDVERVEMKTEERYCLIYFEDPSVIDRVHGRQSHNVDGVDFEIHLHHECLGRRSSRKKSDLYLRMSSLGNKDSETLEDENADNQANDETSSSVSSNPENESDFVEVQKWQANDGIEPVLKLLIKYLKKQGKKTEADLSKHTVPCSMNLQLMWNFFMLTDCGKKLLDVIAANYHCKVSADDYFKEFYIFQVFNRQFHDESDVKHFVDEVLHNIEIFAKESLCIDTIAIDPKIQDEVRERIKDGQELANVWVEFVGEDNPVTVYTVCPKDQQQLVMQIITEVIRDTIKSFNSHNEMVMADFMWQMVMTRFEYLKEILLKFPSTEIIQDKNKNAFLLKGPRDEVKAVAGHLEELLKMAHKEVHEKVFSPRYQFEIFTSSEMCDYIDKSLPKLPVIWIPNHLTKEIHLFSKDPELLKGMDKCIKGCIEEIPYPLSKKHSELSSKQIQLLKELMKKHGGKIVINLSQSPTGLLLTTADDIFKDVYAAVQTIISSEIDEVHLETFVPETPDGKDEQPGSKSQISNPGTEMKYLSSEKVSDLVQKITRSLEVKDKNIFKKLIIMEHMEKINQIAKEHSVNIKVCETQRKVGFLLNGLEKEVQFIYNAIRLQEQQFQQDISVIAGATGKVHKQMLPNSDAAGKSGGSEMSDASFGKGTEQQGASLSSSETPIPTALKNPMSNRGNGSKNDNGEEGDSCTICMCSKTYPKTLSCGHSFCSECIDHMFRHKPICPICGKIVGTHTGDQPKNCMMQMRTSPLNLAGYEGHGSIVITYDFPAGKQEPNHPSPGTWYGSLTRTAYLPNTPEGTKVYKMLRLAFDRRLVFTISQSRTTGKEGLTWNGIHHKTNPKPGGQFGYPDPEYLSRVRDELAANGITEADIQPEKA